MFLLRNQKLWKLKFRMFDCNNNKTTKNDGYCAFESTFSMKDCAKRRRRIYAFFLFTLPLLSPFHTLTPSPSRRLAKCVVEQEKETERGIYREREWRIYMPEQRRTGQVYYIYFFAFFLLLLLLFLFAFFPLPTWFKVQWPILPLPKLKRRMNSNKIMKWSERRSRRALPGSFLLCSHLPPTSTHAHTLWHMATHKVS